MHDLLVLGGICDIVREVDEELGETAFGSCIVAKDRGEGSIAKRLGQTLAKSFARTSIITQTVFVRRATGKSIDSVRTEESIAQHA
jgi:hypothetical protein